MNQFHSSCPSHSNPLETPSRTSSLSCSRLYRPGQSCPHWNYLYCLLLSFESRFLGCFSSSSMLLIWRGKSFILEKECRGGKFESVQNSYWRLFSDALCSLPIRPYLRGRCSGWSLEALYADVACLLRNFHIEWLGGLFIGPKVNMFTVLGEDSCNPSPASRPFLWGPEGNLLEFWKQIRNEGSQLEEFHLIILCSSPRLTLLPLYFLLVSWHLGW